VESNEASNIVAFWVYVDYCHGMDDRGGMVNTAFFPARHYVVYVSFLPSF